MSMLHNSSSNARVCSFADSLLMAFSASDQVSGGVETAPTNKSDCPVVVVLPNTACCSKPRSLALAISNTAFGTPASLAT